MWLDVVAIQDIPATLSKPETQTMNSIKTIRELTIAELEIIDAQVAERQELLDEALHSQSRLKASLKALDTEKKPKAKTASKAATPKKRSPKQKHVRDVARVFATENPGIERAALEELTKQKLKDELGFDLKGFEMRWGEVLASDTFLVADDNTITVATSKAKKVESLTENIGSTDQKLPVERSLGRD